MNRTDITAQNSPYAKTEHFIKRQTQRSIPDTWVGLALTYGQTFYHGGDRVYFLGRKQLQKARKATGAILEQEIPKADGTVVVVRDCSTLVTTYRNPQYIRHLRRCVA